MSELGISQEGKVNMRIIEPLPEEKNREYINRLFTYLFSSQLITPAEMKRLQSEEHTEYRLTNFGFSRPLFVENSQKCKDGNGNRRYYAKPVCGKYHLCKEWYFDEDHSAYNLDKLLKWVNNMIPQTT